MVFKNTGVKCSKVTAFDVAGELVGMAQEKETAKPLGITYLTLDAEQIGQHWRTQEFDLVTASMSLECVPGIELAMEGIANVLKTNGRLAMTAAHPDSENIRTTTDESISKSRNWVPSGLNLRRGDSSAPPIMVWRMSIPDWKQLVTKSGMALESVKEPLLDKSITRDDPNLESGTRNPLFFVLSAQK